MAASSTATAPDASPRVVEDCRGVLKVLSDGTIIRSPAPAVDVPVDPSVEWKDAVYDAALGLGLRLYRPAPPPAAAGDGDGAGTGNRRKKLPVLVAFHGGGFCTNSYATPHFHAACTRLAAGAGALVLSADYRLAPEHRLPAAIHDAAAVLLWLRAQTSSPSADPWLSSLADPSRVFVTGESAGGVLTHHLNVRFSGGGELHPLRLRGFVPLMPFFTGVSPTPSELSCPDGAYLNRDMSARFVRLCLPLGADADHPFLNPFGPGAAELEGVDVAPTLVVVAGDDILRDRNVEFVRRMREMGKPVEMVEFPGQGHAFFSLRAWSEPVGELIRVFKRFMDEACQIQA